MIPILKNNRCVGRASLLRRQAGRPSSSSALPAMCQFLLGNGMTSVEMPGYCRVSLQDGRLRTTKPRSARQSGLLSGNAQTSRRRLAMTRQAAGEISMPIDLFEKRRKKFGDDISLRLRRKSFSPCAEISEAARSRQFSDGPGFALPSSNRVFFRSPICFTLAANNRGTQTTKPIQRVK